MRRTLLALALAAAIVGFFALGLQRSVSLEALRAHEQSLLALKAEHPVLMAGGFFVVYVGVTALSVPGDVPLTLAAGALFGLIEGTILVSFASTIGATLAFLSTRFLFRDVVRRRFSARLASIDAGIEQGGGAYLLSLRLVPAVPFVLVNLLFGVTAFPTARFYSVSQVGMLPATIVYVNAGTGLEQVHRLSDVLSARVLVSLLLLAALPVGARAVAALMARSRSA